MAKILVIDDDVTARTLVVITLQEAGYDVVEAENGAHGLRLLRAQAADLVITDLIMPEKEGLETIQEIRREFPQTKIIAMSGGSRLTAVDFLPMAQMFGAKKTLQKPLSVDKLLGAVKEVLAG